MDRSPALVLGKRSLLWFGVIALLSTFVVIGLSPHSYAQGSTILFSIPEQQIEAALDLYSTQADMSLIYKLEDLKGIDAHAVNGRYSPTQALQILLKDTGLVFEQTTDKTISIKKATDSKSSRTTAGAQMAANAPSSSGASAAGSQSNAGAQSAAQSEEAWAQDFILEDTVVTASKREVKVQSTPMSIQAVTGKKLEKIGAVGFEDFATRIPGLTINAGKQGFNSLQIRGISSMTSDPTASATVGLYIDDTPVSNASQAPDSALFDIERVEVLKGPQGTLYGEGSLGGTIRFITRKPQMNEYEGKIQLIGSSTENSPDLGYQTNGVLNIPLVDDKLAMRLTGSFIDDGGFVTDAKSGDEGTNAFDKANVRASLRYEPSDRLTITPTINYQKTNGGSAAYDAPNYGDLTWFKGIPWSESYEDAYTLFALTVEYDLDWAKLTSNTSYFDRDFSMVQDGASTNVYMAMLGYNSPYTVTYGATQTETFIQELRLVSDNDGPFNWVLGGFYRNREETAQWDMPNDQLLADTGNATVFGFDVLQESKQVALFGEVNYDILDNVTLTYGTRWFKDEIEGNSMHGQIFLDFTAPPGSLKNYVSGRKQAEVSDSGFLHKFALSYNPVETMMLYTQFSQGRRPGGTNVRAGFGTGIDPTFEPDNTNNYEAGIKSDWFDGRLRANAAYYYIDWKDVQLVKLNNTGMISYIVNASEARSTGFELELAAQPVQGFTLGTGMNYSVKAEITEDSAAANDGDRLPWSPRFSGNVFAEYAYRITDSLTGLAGARLPVYG